MSLQVEVEGIVRGSEQPSSFVPANDPASGQWFWIDVPALARAAGLPLDTPLVEARSLQALIHYYRDGVNIKAQAACCPTGKRSGQVHAFLDMWPLAVW